MDGLHSLLVRQLKRYFGEPARLPDDWSPLLNAVSDVYRDYDMHREMLERSLVLSTRELHRANTEMRAIFQALPDLLFRLDYQGTILDLKAGTTGDLLRDSGELVGKKIQNIPVKPVGKQFQDALQRVLAASSLVSFEYALVLRGEECFYQARLVPLHDNQIVVMIQNVTERKRAEVKLNEANRRLLEVSRQAGMAEVATNILHNVGNFLNSVNISSTLVARLVKKSRAAGLSRAVTLLQDHAQDLGAFLTRDPRGKELPDYLHQLAEHLAGEQNAILQELERLAQNINHIKDTVAMQQNFARVSGIVETVHLADLVEDALQLNADSLQRHEVAVSREFEAVPALKVEKHKILQILVNLIRNAKQACHESGRTDKRMTVRVAGGEGRVRVTVMDNGVGITPENLTRIFSHGFTTRKDGHGFGLHSGALMAEEMGGALNVQSDGVGKGATFTLELPVSPPPPAAP